MKEYLPGQTFLKKDAPQTSSEAGLAQLIITLSSDKEHGFDSETPVWRCASFRSLRHGGYMGAQFVLYTETELGEMTYSGDLPVPVEAKDKPESILSKIEAIKRNARKEGVRVEAVSLGKKEYTDFINTPVVSRTIQALRIAGTAAKRHIMWDGMQIVNNSIPLEEKERLIKQTLLCLDCHELIDLFQIVSNLQERVKELERS